MPWLRTSVASLFGDRDIVINRCVVLLSPSALNVHSLALGAVLEWRPLRSATSQSTVVIAFLTLAVLTVHSLASGAALERPPGSAFSHAAGGRKPPRRLLLSPSVCCTVLFVKGLGRSGRSLAFLQFAGLCESDYCL